LAGVIVAELAATALAACNDSFGMAAINAAGGVICFVFLSLGVLWQGVVSRALQRSTSRHAEAARQNPRANYRVNQVMRLFRINLRFAEWTWDHPWLVGLGGATLVMGIFAVLEIYGAATRMTCE
jgi:hypothetical protein